MGNIDTLNNFRIGSNEHQWETISNNKESLSAFDYKRYILKNGLDILPFGLYLGDIAAFREILTNPEWGEERNASSASWYTLLRDYDPHNFDDRFSRTLPEPSTPARQRERHSDSLRQLLIDSWSPLGLAFYQDKYTV